MALLLQTQPGVGAVTALAYVLTMGDVSRRLVSGLAPQKGGTQSPLACSNVCQSLRESPIARAKMSGGEGQRVAIAHALS